MADNRSDDQDDDRERRWRTVHRQLRLKNGLLVTSQATSLSRDGCIIRLVVHTAWWYSGGTVVQWWFSDGTVVVQTGRQKNGETRNEPVVSSPTNFPSSDLRNVSNTRWLLQRRPVILFKRLSRENSAISFKFNDSNFLWSFSLTHSVRRLPSQAVNYWLESRPAQPYQLIESNLIILSGLPAHKTPGYKNRPLIRIKFVEPESHLPICSSTKKDRLWVSTAYKTLGYENKPLIRIKLDWLEMIPISGLHCGMLFHQNFEWLFPEYSFLVHVL